MNNGERPYWLQFEQREERLSRPRSAAAPRNRSADAGVPLQEMNRNNPGQQTNNSTIGVNSPDEGPKDEEPEPGTLPPRPARSSRLRSSYQTIIRFGKSCFATVVRKLFQEGEVKVGWVRAAFILLTEQVGLALAIAPYIFYVLGYIGGSITYLVVSALGYYTNMILYRHRKEHGVVASICDVARTVLGAWGQWSTFAFFNLCAIMITAAHIREGGDFLSISRDPTPAPLMWIYELLCPSIANTALPAFLILFVALPRNLRVLSFISMATVPLTIASVTGALGVLWTDDRKDKHGSKPGIFGYETAFGVDIRYKINAVLIVIFTFLVQPTVPMLISDMRNINHFPRALRWSTGFQVVLFVLIGSLGAALRGHGPFRGTVFVSLPNNTLSTALYGMIQPSVVLQAGLFINVLGRELWQSCRLDRFKCFKGKPRFSRYWFSRQIAWLQLLGKSRESRIGDHANVESAFLVFMAFMIAGIVPDLDNIIGLVATIPGAFFFFILPAFVLFYHIRVNREHALPGEADGIIPRNQGWVLTTSTCLVLSGILMFTLGLWSSVNMFKHHAGSNLGGPRGPFSCAAMGVEGKLLGMEREGEYAN